jgi:hypothetical protein
MALNPKTKFSIATTIDTRAFLKKPLEILQNSFPPYVSAYMYKHNKSNNASKHKKKAE